MLYSDLNNKLAKHPDFMQFKVYHVPIIYTIHDAPLGTWNCYTMSDEPERLLREFMYHIVREHCELGAYEFYTTIYDKEL